MYETFYGFREKPFSLLPDPAYLYLSKQHQMAMTLLEYGLENQAGFCVVTGAAGTGKTTLIRRLLGQIGNDISVGLISNTHHSFGELMRWIALAFGLETKDEGKARLHRALVDYLIAQYAKNKRTLLIVDEAQNLSVGALEELRMLSNINSEKDLVLQVVLVGQPGLRSVLRRPDLAQFAQRIGVDYHLEPLNPLETRGYIRHRIMKAGGERELFSEDGCEAVHEYSGGIPRLINLLCDLSLVYAYAAQAAVVTEDLVEQVVRERQNQNALPIFKKAAAAEPAPSAVSHRAEATTVAPQPVPLSAAREAVGAATLAELVHVSDMLLEKPPLPLVADSAHSHSYSLPDRRPVRRMPEPAAATVSRAVTRSVARVAGMAAQIDSSRDADETTTVVSVVQKENSRMRSVSPGWPAAPPVSQAPVAESQTGAGRVMPMQGEPGKHEGATPVTPHRPKDFGLPDPGTVQRPAFVQPAAARYFFLGSAATLLVLLVGVGAGFLLSQCSMNVPAGPGVSSEARPPAPAAPAAVAANPAAMPSGKKVEHPAPIVTARDDGLDELRLEILDYQRAATLAMARSLERERNATLDPAEARERALAAERATALAREREQTYQSMLAKVKSQRD